MICEFTKMSETFKEMTSAYQLATKRIDVLEKDHQGATQKINILEKYREEDTQRIRKLEEKNNVLEEKVKQADKRIVIMESNLGKRIESLQNEIVEFQDVQKNRALVPKGPSFNEANFQHLEQFTQRIGMLEKNWGNLKTEIRDIKDLTSRSKSQLTGEIEELKRQCTVSIPSSKVPMFGGEMMLYERASSDEVKQVEEKVLELERTLNVISVHHSELELQLQASLASTHNGAFLWRIPEVRRRIRDAKIGRITSIYSPPFYTGRNGYKMCIRAYLNGDGSGEGTHLSIFFVLMKGEYDSLLQWPFESKVSLILVDQDHMKHLVQSFKPNSQSSSFQRPKTDMNVASGCPEFAELSTLDNTSYVKDDQLYIKAIVDISKIFHP